MDATVPRVTPWLLQGFVWYCRRYIRRHFHSLRIASEGMAPAVEGRPLLVFANHASWWDPPERDPACWTSRLQDALATTQEALADLAKKRDPASFHTLVKGGAGQGGFYDVWRRLEARARGAPFRKEHGGK